MAVGCDLTCHNYYSDAVQIYMIVYIRSPPQKSSRPFPTLQVALLKYISHSNVVSLWNTHGEY